MSPPPTKRKRTNSQLLKASGDSESHNIKSLTRSEHFYLEDGNIILAAEGIAFRVHRSQLARQSEVFRDMLDVVSQPSDAEVFDGCPVVRLSDTHQDVLELLQALYDSVRFDLRKMDQLAGVLRLSTKYLVEPLRAAAIELLAEAYPDTLNKYDHSYSCINKPYRPNCWDVIKLAHEVHADILLPAAYYDLCGHAVEDVLKYGLSTHVMLKYLVGKEKLVPRLASFVGNKIQDRTLDLNACLQGSTCSDAFEEMEKIALKSLIEPHCTSNPDPLFNIKEFPEYDWNSQACSICREHFRCDVESERRNIWSSLAGIFDFGSWDEVRKKM